MRPVTLSQAGVGGSAVCPTDIYANPTSIALTFTPGAGATATVQYTFDDVFSATFDPGTAVWYNHPNMTNLVAETTGTIVEPVRGVRLNQTVGATTSTLKVLQGGGVGGN